MKIAHGPVDHLLIELIDGAQDELVLVSPYIELWSLLVQSIERAATRGVDIRIVTRGGKDGEKNKQKLRCIEASVRYVGFLERLHAKLYLSEKAALMTSLNLNGGSALNTIELAALFEKRYMETEHRQLRRFCKDLIEKCGEEEQRIAAKGRQPQPAQAARGKALRWGHCIRCSERIAFDVSAPLCTGCFTSWNRYKNKDYSEDYCLRCGDESETSFREPICSGCSSPASRSEARV